MSAKRNKHTGIEIRHSTGCQRTSVEPLHVRAQVPR